MNYYTEIELINTPFFSQKQLWSKLYMQLHIALAEIKDINNKVKIGVSFPQYHFYEKKGVGFLGSKLRIFAQSKIDLENLNLTKWLEGISDYININPLRKVPQEKIIGHAIYYRKQVKTNAERLARNRAKRGNISYEEALSRYSNVVTTTNLPYIRMSSLTTKCDFKLFIEKKYTEGSTNYTFSTYGLSSISSVPEF